MTIEQIRELTAGSSYDFLRTDRRLGSARANTGLPDQPDFERVQEFVMDVNRRALA